MCIVHGPYLPVTTYSRDKNIVAFGNCVRFRRLQIENNSPNSEKSFYRQILFSFVFFHKKKNVFFFLNHIKIVIRENVFYNLKIQTNTQIRNADVRKLLLEEKKEEAIYSICQY